MSAQMCERIPSAMNQSTFIPVSATQRSPFILLGQKRSNYSIRCLKLIRHLKHHGHRPGLDTHIIVLRPIVSFDRTTGQGSLRQSSALDVAHVLDIVFIRYLKY